jgi:hypothetical protein
MSWYSEQREKARELVARMLPLLKASGPGADGQEELVGMYRRACENLTRAESDDVWENYRFDYGITLRINGWLDEHHPEEATK